MESGDIPIDNCFCICELYVFERVIRGDCKNVLSTSLFNST